MADLSTPESVETTAPSVADGVDRSLDPQSITADRLSGAIAVVVFALASLIGVAIFGLTSPWGAVGAISAFLLWAAAHAAAGAFALWWPGVRYRYVSYCVSDQGIVIRRGVLWRSVHSVPRSRVQHTDVSQGPIERAFGLATLVVYTAGTAHASVSLAGLPHAAAARIRDYLIEGGADDAV